MAKTEVQKEAPLVQTEKPVETRTVEVVGKNINDLFKRSINAGSPVRSLTMRRVLTRPLVSMSKRKQLACRVESEIYSIDLPLTGRAGGMGEARVFDATELVPTEGGFVDGDQIIVTCHEIMCSSLAKSGYASMKDVSENGTHVRFEPITGKSLKGALLGFITGEIADGKRYRSISVAELE